MYLKEISVGKTGSIESSISNVDKMLKKAISDLEEIDALFTTQWQEWHFDVSKHSKQT